MTPPPDLRQKIALLIEEHVLIAGSDSYLHDAKLMDDLLALIESEKRKAVEEARENFFITLEKAKHPYIGKLRRRWIQSSPSPNDS